MRVIRAIEKGVGRRILTKIMTIFEAKKMTFCKDSIEILQKRGSLCQTTSKLQLKYLIISVFWKHKLNAIKHAVIAQNYLSPTYPA
jgi:hypothetical protein